MRVNFFIVLFLFNFFLYNGSYAEINNKIIVKVGNKIITSLDIQNKILSSLILTGNNVNQENINKLKKKSLIDLVNIRLKENEVEETGTTIDQGRVNDYLNKISSNNLENLKIKFTEFNIDFKLFVEEIETELKWQKYIYEKYSKKIKIDENLILNEVNKIIKEELIFTEINLKEIQVSKDSMSSNEKIISDILNEININGFENTAIKLSISNTAQEKGDLGWINKKTLSKRIFAIVDKLKIGEVSKPIVQTNSILFLKLNDVRKVSKDNIDRTKIKNDIMLKKQNEIFNQYSISHLSTIRNKFLIQYK